MSRINTNISSMVAQKNLAKSNSNLQTSLNRLSTGLRVNSGKDDPAGLISSELLRRDITAVSKGIKNSERAGQFIATADSALSQVSSLLNDVRGLVTEAANSGALSDEQISANQLQIDSSLEAIDRIAKTTNFQGKRMLDGSMDFQVTAGNGFTTVSDYTINQASLDSSDEMNVSVSIANAAEVATLTVAANGFNNGALNDSLVLKLGGKDGAEVFSFDAGASVSSIAEAINLVSESTGIEASVNNNVLTLESTAYGSKSFVDAEVISEGGTGTFATNLSATRDTGADIVATVNGVKAVGDGNTLSINTSTLGMSLTVDEGSSTAVAFTINGGGAKFQLGADVVGSQQARMGLKSVFSGSLGGSDGRLYELKSGGDKSLANDPNGAAKVVDDAITQVAALRGRLGAFQKTTIDSNVAALSDLAVNLSDAESSIRDADFAVESANLTRAQVLVSAGTQVLSIAGQNPQNALQLLR
jgi:flagellin